jgi:hypothetical protein
MDSNHRFLATSPSLSHAQIGRGGANDHRPLLQAPARALGAYACVIAIGWRPCGRPPRSLRSTPERLKPALARSEPSGYQRDEPFFQLTTLSPSPDADHRSNGIPLANRTSHSLCPDIVEKSGISRRPDDDITPQDRVTDSCLLLLFMATAAASLLLQSEISEQFSGVVDDYLPLNAAVSTIDVFTDRYELDLMRLSGAEMHPLFDRLTPEFRVSTVDSPGFGDLVRPRTIAVADA